MPEAATGRFTDPAEYQASLPDVTVELVVTGVGAFDAQLTWAKLPNVRLVRAQEALARVAYITMPAGPVLLSFATQGATGLYWNGVELRAGDMVFHSEGERFHQRTSGHARWGYISIAPVFFARYGSALSGQPLAPPVTGRIVRPRAADLARLLRLHARVAKLVEVRLIDVGHPEVVRALEHALLLALVTSLTASDAKPEAFSHPQHVRTLAGLEAMLAAKCGRTIDVRELCAALGVTDRTLRTCCQDFLGLSPTRYLRLRRLKLVRTEFLRADPTTAQIGDIARQYGFVDGGRFVATYSQTFGETPSMTLARGQNLA